MEWNIYNRIYNGKESEKEYIYIHFIYIYKSNQLYFNLNFFFNFLKRINV